MLGGRLWHAECGRLGAKAEGGPAPTIPYSFASIDDYIGAFDPLILEEGRESLKSEWAEGCAAGRLWPVEVVRVEEQADGWAAVRLRPLETPADPRQAFQPNSVAVLSLGRPPQRGAADWAQAQLSGRGGGGGGNGTSNGPGNGGGDGIGNGNQQASKRQRLERGQSPGGAGASAAAPAPSASSAEAGGGHIVAGLVQRSKDGNDLLVHIHPRCRHHAGGEGAAEGPCAAVLRALREHPRRWWLVPGRGLVSSVSPAPAAEGGALRLLSWRYQ